MASILENSGSGRAAFAVLDDRGQARIRRYCQIKQKANVRTGSMAETKSLALNVAYDGRTRT